MRLTQKDPSGRWSLRGVDLQALPPEVYGALCKLLAYEDTGLDPDEVERMKDAAELGEGSAHHMRIRAQMAGTIKALTEEVEGLEAAYDKAMRDLNISATLISMIKEKVKEELR